MWGYLPILSGDVVPAARMLAVVFLFFYPDHSRFEEGGDRVARERLLEPPSHVVLGRRHASENGRGHATSCHGRVCLAGTARRWFLVFNWGSIGPQSAGSLDPHPPPPARRLANANKMGAPYAKGFSIRSKKGRSLFEIFFFPARFSFLLDPRRALKCPAPLRSDPARGPMLRSSGCEICLIFIFLGKVVRGGGA